MAEHKEKGIYVITQAIAATGAKDGQDTGASYRSNPKKSTGQKVREFVSAEMLKSQISGFLDVIEDVFSNNLKAASEMELDEISFSLDIDANGKVSLMGNGVEVGTTGGIQVTFKRKDSAKSD
ncbi:hypothetical protein Lepto7376_1985 [[Leptolyngbya] sp. PCC 7376]|uniref:Pepco domain-containing protein n=1 Tax=[Leptolyngbya] sp. PCC 7376 TaxID=111781 RepID=UPI00029F1C09|nr:hypothetical protein [[Leptolyngbya] sp. PCC 7376]AFY38295.1 hypothetical protein Lepto7376_1985 [[Leptolyngbya] sp. PCC 7376]